jgi:hypothetical protein
MKRWEARLGDFGCVMEQDDDGEFVRHADAEALRDCLDRLHSVQNGCQLPKYEADWNTAMTDAARLLGYTKETT